MFYKNLIQRKNHKKIKTTILNIIEIKAIAEIMNKQLKYDPKITISFIQQTI